MKTLTMMIALFALSTAAMAESNYTPRQTQAAQAEAQAAAQANTQPASQAQDTQDNLRNAWHYTHH